MSDRRKPRVRPVAPSESATHTRVATTPRSAAYGAPGRAHGPSGSRCCPPAPPVSGAQAHCSTCHETFGGVRGFDLHRRGGVCNPPASVGLADRDGVWRSPMSDADRERRGFTPAAHPAVAMCHGCADDALGPKWGDEKRRRPHTCGKDRAPGHAARGGAG